MSPLVAQWHALAKAESDVYDSRDSFYVVETTDPRVPHTRRVASGGVADGRPEKPGVLLVAITDDGYEGTLGVSSVDEARMIMTVLRRAWPELVRE